MKDCDLLINCGWVLTVDAENTVLSDHAIVVVDGRITAILPNESASKTYRPQTLVDRSQHIVAPGLINTHTHLAMNLLRGYADDLPLMTWLQEKIWPLEQQHVGPDFVGAGTRLALAESIRAGVTCVNDMYFFAERTADELTRAGMRGRVGMLVLDFETAWAKDAASYIQRGLEMHDSLRNNERVATCFAPHAPYTVSRKPLERIQVLSTELDLPVHMHIHETAAEVQEFEAKHGLRPLAMLHDMGMLGPALIAVHMTQLSSPEQELVALHRVHVAHCPESNMKLASGCTPVAALQDAGCNVAIGTDGAASNNDLDLLAEVRTASLMAKMASTDAAACNAQQSLRMATINGARALGIDNLTGSLEPGKAADIICVETQSPEMQPLYEPVSQLIYAAGRESVTDVWVDGKPLMQQRQLLTVDLAQTLSDAKQWAAKLAG